MPSSPVPHFGELIRVRRIRLTRIHHMVMVTIKPTRNGKTLAIRIRKPHGPHSKPHHPAWSYRGKGYGWRLCAGPFTLTWSTFV